MQGEPGVGVFWHFLWRRYNISTGVSTSNPGNNLDFLGMSIGNLKDDHIPEIH
jgi:hypothetical protein